MKGYTAAKVRILYRKMQISLAYLYLVRQCAGREGRHVNCGALLVCIFGTRRQTDMRPKGHWFPAPAGRVSGGRKISGLLFKISGSDFEIRATNFLFAPTPVLKC